MIFHHLKLILYSIFKPFHLIFKLFHYLLMIYVHLRNKSFLITDLNLNCIIYNILYMISQIIINLWYHFNSLNYFIIYYICHHFFQHFISDICHIHNPFLQVNHFPRNHRRLGTISIFIIKNYNEYIGFYLSDVWKKIPSFFSKIITFPNKLKSLSSPFFLTVENAVHIYWKKEVVCECSFQFFNRNFWKMQNVGVFKTFNNAWYHQCFSIDEKWNINISNDHLQGIENHI